MRRLAALVDELLRLTRAEGDPTARAMDTVALDALLHKVASDVAVEAESRGCRLCLLAGHLVLVTGDAELLRRAFENVMRNGR